MSEGLTYPALSARFAASLGSSEQRRTYRRVLGSLERWAANEGVSPLDLSAAGLATFLSSGTVGHGPTDQARARSALTEFFAFATACGALRGSPAAAQETLAAAAETSPISAHDLLWLIDAADLVDQPICTLVLLLAVNGIGVQEALSLDVESLTTSRGTAVARLPRRWGRRSVIPLCRPVRAATQATRDGRSSGPLLTGATSAERLGLIEAGQRLAAAAASAGITRSITPEVLEQTFVALAVEAGVPAAELRHAAGEVENRDSHTSYAAFTVSDHMSMLDPNRFA
ncbi:MULTISPECIES: hypothetical protein [unclassified Pseudonocardia]|uniref:hypothetical protein n=1 Tax=unclassified Pseudonocardia TaxID=2619320 RepID=UPI0001FFDA62|nr:hypothetical protein [Pseudonocardia sp. Ae707_Ps1]OLM09081.1 hypothetical protein Ae707Ps1_6028c [Pseudonocardia sp. Ae707_Ps1]